MNLRITATYAATDGGMPESVDVVWDDLEVDNHPNKDDVRDVIDMLIGAPGVRRSTYAANRSMAVPSPAPSAGRKYRAGGDLPVGTWLAWADNGLTLYPVGHQSGRYDGAGVALEHIPVGTAMQKDEAQSSIGRTAWIKETT